MTAASAPSRPTSDLSGAAATSGTHGKRATPGSVPQGGGWEGHQEARARRLKRRGHMPAVSRASWTSETDGGLSKACDLFVTLLSTPAFLGLGFFCFSPRSPGRGSARRFLSAPLVFEKHSTLAGVWWLTSGKMATRVSLALMQALLGRSLLESWLGNGLTFSVQEVLPSTTNFFPPREEMSFAGPSTLLLLSPVAGALLRADIPGLCR